MIPTSWLPPWRNWGSDMEKDYGHKPVLLEECLTALDIKPEGIYLDGTLGRAGHSLEILRRLKGGRLIGIDQDADAIAAAGERLKEFGSRVTIVRSNYENIREILENLVFISHWKMI